MRRLFYFCFLLNINLAQAASPCPKAFVEVFARTKLAKLHPRIQGALAALGKMEKALEDFQSFADLDRSINLDALMKLRDQAMTRVMADTSLIPEGGTYHVIGPSFNFYEWMLPLVARSDITVHVSDPDLHYIHQLFSGGSTEPEGKVYLRKVYEKFLADKTHLKEMSPALGSFEKFYAFVKDRVFFHDYAEEIPGQADFVLSRLPQVKTGNMLTPFADRILPRMIDGALKPGGLAWVIPEIPKFDPNTGKTIFNMDESRFYELGYPDSNVVSFSGEMAEFYPEPTTHHFERQLRGIEQGGYLPTVDPGYFPGFPETVENALFVVKPESDARPQ